MQNPQSRQLVLYFINQEDSISYSSQYGSSNTYKTEKLPNLKNMSKLLTSPDESKHADLSIGESELQQASNISHKVVSKHKPLNVPDDTQASLK